MVQQRCHPDAALTLCGKFRPIGRDRGIEFDFALVHQLVQTQGCGNLVLEKTGSRVSACHGIVLAGFSCPIHRSTTVCP